MTCDKYSEMISAFIDGELDDSERQALEEHLSQCSHCRTEYNRQLQMRTALREDEIMTIPRNVENRIKKSIGIDSGRTGIFGGSYRIPRPVAWVAAAALIVLTINTIFFNKEDDRKDIPQTQSEEVQTIMLTEADRITISTNVSRSIEGGQK